ncbi:thiosulfate oxidation carrier protein SoxY [Rubrivivax gelatinosus]|uniref:Putative sulfur oxidation protein SoxY n=1 Tax=Rubrivivax gelatinosus (strain NBRC 100245 / IL144) TaxID=983917 RepID=I0HT98_RUBGI|nr:thiosulfate oxidation carrier protein SoxY [Rubrivivax gelatinosus]BAL96235.1 putative sulfur oxidation protein SoxY [Rubrivivax gelatinosus IL144]
MSPALGPDLERRDTLAAGVCAAMLASLGLWPRAAGAAALPPAFEAASLAELQSALGIATPQPSAEVTLSGPDVAENGAAVELTFGTSLVNAQRLLLLVEHNPALLSAIFELSEAVEPEFTLRIKMAESSPVWAVATTSDARVFFARKEIRVTLGGCAA